MGFQTMRLKWVQRNKPSEMLTTRLPAAGASHFCLCSGCCSCTMGSWRTLESWASQDSPLELSAWRGMLRCSKGQNEAEEVWWVPRAGYSASPCCLAAQGQYWPQAGYPVLVSPPPAVSLSPSTTDRHLNICSEVPRHTSLSPHPLCSDRRPNCTLSYIMEPLNLLYSQGRY